MHKNDPGYAAAKARVESLVDQNWSPAKILQEGKTGITERSQIAGIVFRYQERKRAAAGLPKPERRRKNSVRAPSKGKPQTELKPAAIAHQQATRAAASKERQRLLDAVHVEPVKFDFSLEGLAPHLYRARPYQPGDEKREFKA
jgi:hypothetical protein